MDLYLGVDVGTSSMKLLVVNKEGTIQKSVSKKYTLHFPKVGWAEQNPEDWWEALQAGILELEELRKSIKGISFSGQMHGLVILDDGDDVIRPAILWNDQRTNQECDYLNHQIGKEKLTQWTGNIALTGFTAPKLLWLRKHEPDHFQKINKIMLPKDYLAYRLSGVFTTDTSDASGTLYFDVKNRVWSQEMLDILGIKETQLPKVYESYEMIGTIQPSLASELGLNELVIIIIGGGDQAVGAIGTGTVLPNGCSISLGTSGVVFVASDYFSVDANNALHSFCHANGKYHLMGVMLSAAGALQWWVETIGQHEDYDRVLAEVKKTEMDERLFFLPYLIGERTPINDQRARGVFMGLSLHHKQAHMTRAVMEGVVFALRDSFEILKELGLKIEEVRVTGGGSKSEIWLNMIANILGIRVSTVNTSEGPALGAAILAMVGCGEYQSVVEACQTIIKVEKTIDCDKEHFSIYHEKYLMFKKIYPALKDLF